MEDKERARFESMGPDYGVKGWEPKIPGGGQGIVASPKVVDFPDLGMDKDEFVRKYIEPAAAELARKFKAGERLTCFESALIQEMIERRMRQ